MPQPLSADHTDTSPNSRILQQSLLNHTGPNWLNAWALRLAKLRGKKRATIALARRIGVVLHRMWRDGTEFQFTREDAMALRTA